MTDLAARPAARASGVAAAWRPAVVLPLGLVLVAIVAALFLFGGVEAQLTDIMLTQQVRQQARDLLQGLVDAESGQRGFLLTQDPAYLAPYRAADHTIDASYRTLVTLVQSDQQAQRALADVLADITSKRHEMASTIALVEAGEIDQAIAVVESDAGKAAMDQIRSQIGAFVSHQDDLLADRNAEVAVYRQGLIVAIMAALAGAAVLGFVLFSRSQRRVSDLSQRQSALIEQTQRLEETVLARTVDAEEARERAERERARVEALLQETSHRIGNSLATVSSLLGLQVTRTKSEAVRLELEAAQSRVQAIASGYRRLRLGADMETVDAGEFLDSVIDDLAATTTAATPVRLVKELEPLIIPARDATTIGIIVNELVTNALKHAFPGGSGGEIRVGLHRRDDGVVLTVRDDGAGLAEAGAGTGLGSLIIHQLARQFGGEPRYESPAGHGTLVTVPLPELARLAAS
jgi:two-component sensor histidine kinase/CHASE3 domain sensor protein